MGLSISPICTRVSCGGLIVKSDTPCETHRGRRERVYDASVMPPKRKAPEDNTPKRATRRRPIVDATPVLSKRAASLDEPDELNLSPTKPPVAPSTPGPRLGSSRVILDYVEIATPRAIALTSTHLTSLPSPVKLPSVLPAHLLPSLRLQKRAVLNALQSSLSSEEIDDHSYLSTNATSYAQLHDLLHGTTSRGEGNSCLLLGPRGSGKTSVRISYNE